METTQLRLIIEAAILAVGEPVTADKLLQLFAEDTTVTLAQIKQVLADMVASYTDNGFELKQVASGYIFQARQEYAPWLQKLWEEKPPRYSRALLETLAIIAYRQPVTRGDIEDIRGVAVSTQMIKTLEDRNWVKVIGHRDVPGKPAIFGTTKAFLDYFNLQTLDQLPSLQDIADLEALAEKLQPELALHMEHHEQITENAEANEQHHDITPEQQQEQIIAEHTQQESTSKAEQCQDSEYHEEYGEAEELATADE